MYVPATYREMRGAASGTLFRWRNESSWAEKTLAAFFFAMLMALAGEMYIFLPFTPVPFTGEVLVVLVSAVCLGRYGALSQAMYIGMGASFGWFSGMIGAAALFSVTGGYLIGFLVAAMFLGELVERRQNWNVLSLTLAMCVAVGIIYAGGVIWISQLLQMDLASAATIGALPFVAVDGLKVALAVGVCSLLVPGRE